jgi:hypothetical protein
MRPRSHGSIAVTSLILLLLTLSGCGGAAAPAQTASPSPSPTPTVAPTPSPTPIDTAAAFVKVMANPQFSANVVVTGKLTIGKLEVAMSGEMALSGRDSRSSITLDMPGAPQTTESVTVGVDGYKRTKPGPWLGEAKSSSGTSMTDALARLLNASDAGVVTKNGQALHHIVPTGGFSIPPSAVGLTDPAITDPKTSVDFYALADGTPALLALSISWTQTAGGQSTPCTVQMDMAFRDVGTAIAIQAPEDVWATTTSKRFNYSVAHPSDWVLVEAKANDEFGPSGQSIVYVAPQQVGTVALAAFGDQLVATYNKEFSVAKPESDVASKLGGQAARLLTYHWKSAAGQNLVLYDAVTVRAGTGWEVFLIDVAGNEAADLALFETLVASFAFAT